MDTVQKLDMLYGLKAQIAKREAEKLAKIDEVMTPEIRQAVLDIEVEFQVPADVLDKLNDLEAEIKEEVKEAASTIRSNHLMAVFTQGKRSWNADALDGYSEAHPEIKQFMTIGKSSVSIRPVEKK